jgi:hypothetical protein
MNNRQFKKISFLTLSTLFLFLGSSNCFSASYTSSGDNIFVKLNAQTRSITYYDYLEYEKSSNLRNAFIQTIPLTDENGKPVTFPLGRLRRNSYQKRRNYKSN